MPESLQAGSSDSLRIVFECFPQEARNAPWDGGFIWTKDLKGNPWIAVACEGASASSWWPDKDHLSDEPDNACINLLIPQSLTAVSNGTL